jgi:hypothetical protein
MLFDGEKGYCRNGCGGVKGVEAEMELRRRWDGSQFNGNMGVE